MINLKDTSSEKLQNNKTILKATIIANTNSVGKVCKTRSSAGINTYCNIVAAGSIVIKSGKRVQEGARVIGHYW